MSFHAIADIGKEMTAGSYYRGVLSPQRIIRRHMVPIYVSELVPP